MPLKATELYGKIAEQMKRVRKADWKEAVQVQDALLASGRFVAVGDLLLQEHAIDAEANRAIVVQHKVTNVIQDDKILAGWLVDQGLAQKDAVEASIQESRLAVKEGLKKIPRLVSILVQKDLLPAEARETALRVHREVLAPLHEMTRYFTDFVDPTSKDVTRGRMAYQNHHASREDLFAALLPRAPGAGPQPVLESLRTAGRLSPEGEASIRQLMSKFGS